MLPRLHPLSSQRSSSAITSPFSLPSAPLLLVLLLLVVLLLPGTDAAYARLRTTDSTTTSSPETEALTTTTQPEEHHHQTRSRAEWQFDESLAAWQKEQERHVYRTTIAAAPSSSDPNEGPSSSSSRRYRATSQESQKQKATTANAVVGTTDKDSESSTSSVLSYYDVCGADSVAHCKEKNPYKATFCLVGSKDKLTPDCRDYTTAKVNCYLSSSKLCKEFPSTLQCLHANRFSTILPGLCTRTKFFEFVRSGVNKDVPLDLAANGHEAQ